MNHSPNGIFFSNVSSIQVCSSFKMLLFPCQCPIQLPSLLFKCTSWGRVPSRTQTPDCLPYRGCGTKNCSRTVLFLMCTARTKPRHGSGSSPLISNISPTSGYQGKTTLVKGNSNLWKSTRMYLLGSERLSGSGKTITFRWMLHEGKILSMPDGKSSVPLLHWSITLSEPCITGWERSPTTNMRCSPFIAVVKIWVMFKTSPCSPATTFSPTL